MSEVGLLLANLLKSKHNTAKRINIDSGFVNFKLDLLKLIHERFEKSLSLLVEILGETILPFVNPLKKGVFDLISLKLKSSNLMMPINFIDFICKLFKLLKLVLIILKSRLLFVEISKLLVHLFLPEPREFIETGLEFNYVVSSSLDGTSEQENNLDDFFVTSNPSVERLAIFFR